MDNIDPNDYTALGAQLGLRHTCEVELHQPARLRTTAPADHATRPLVVTLTPSYGPWSDSPPRPILTVTHRTTGLSVAGSYPATKAGLRQARAAVRVLVKAEGFSWVERDPASPGVDSAEADRRIKALLLAEWTP